MVFDSRELVMGINWRSVGTFWGDGSVLYLDADLGFTDVSICHNSECTIKSFVLVCKIH